MQDEANFRVNILISKKHIVALLLFSISCFILGITLPVFSTTKFYIFRQDVTLIRSILLLFNSGSIFLGIVILSFSIVFPISKYIAIIIILFASNNELTSKINNILKHLGKYSMLDVFIIALIVIVMKLGNGMFSVQIKWGTIIFVFSVLSSIIITSLLKK